MIRRGIAAAFLAGTAAAASGAPAAPVADLILKRGNVHTLDPGRPRAEAIAIAGGRILAVGSDADALRHAGAATRVIDLAGRTVVPGLVDAHAHLGSLGSLLTGELDLRDARSFDEVLESVKEAAAKAPKGSWLVGGRWDQSLWGEKELPTRTRLDAITPDHPVWLSRVDGHAGLANARALDLAGITASTREPSGGAILRDARGEPTGLFVDNATDLVENVVPAEARTTGRKAILAAQERCLAAGLTGVHDAGVSIADVETYRALAAEGALKLRVYAMLAAGAALPYIEHAAPLVDAADGLLTVRAVKCVVDGAMGSRGAWLLAPYDDRPRDDAGKPYAGLTVQPVAEIERIARAAARRGYQLATHAIGDRGNREVLDLYDRVLAGRGGDHRFRIEHAQLLHLDDVPRFARLGVIASMQPTHATSDMRWAEDRVGRHRLAGAYAWARLLRSGARIAGGSDFPVESESPLLGIYAAVTRQDHAGKPEGGWLPAERLSREEALRLFTTEAAYAGFAEARRGRLAVGLDADLVVLARDILTCTPAEIPTTRVELTMVAGRIAYEASP